MQQHWHTVLSWAVVVAWFPTVSWADAPSAAPSDPAQLEDVGLEALSGIIRQIALKNAPHEFEDSDDWGKTKRMWDGLKVSMDGLRIKTKRRHKDANHGSWKKYRAWLIKPQQELQIRLENLREIPGKGAGFDLVLETPLGAAARWSEWRLDVQLYSISAEADAKIRLRMQCELGMSVALAGFSPRVQLEPRITDANLQLIDFRLHRISKLDGPVVKELGRALRTVLREELERRNDKLVARINRAIEKNQHKLQLSAQDLVGKPLGRILEKSAARSTPEEAPVTSPAI
jgi:hypothetical protein